MNGTILLDAQAAFTARNGIPFIFAGTRKGAEYICWFILRQYLESAKKRWKRIAEAHCA